jgi:hypothetical protein
MSTLPLGRRTRSNMGVPQMETTFDEVLSTFLVTSNARREYDKWRTSPLRIDKGVIDTVTNLRTRVVYTITPHDVRTTCGQSEHALGEIQWNDIKRIDSAKNWQPTYAFTHLLHYLMEKDGTLPTWQRFLNFFTRDRIGRLMLGDEAAILRDQLVTTGVSYENASNALIWRAGNAYYGLVRDIYTVVSLRVRGIDARAHPLADALFRVDSWIGREILSIRVRNKIYADGVYGRKLRAEDLLVDSNPPFSYKAIELDPIMIYGKIKLPSEDALSEYASEIHRQNR